MSCFRSSLQSNWVSSPKDTVFPETIPEESSSTEDEHVVSQNDDVSMLENLLVRILVTDYHFAIAGDIQATVAH